MSILLKIIQIWCLFSSTSGGVGNHRRALNLNLVWWLPPNAGLPGAQEKEPLPLPKGKFIIATTSLTCPWGSHSLQKFSNLRLGLSIYSKPENNLYLFPFLTPPRLPPAWGSFSNSVIYLGTHQTCFQPLSYRVPFLWAVPECPGIMCCSNPKHAAFLPNMSKL